MSGRQSRPALGPATDQRARSSRHLLKVDRSLRDRIVYRARRDDAVGSPNSVAAGIEQDLCVDRQKLKVIIVGQNREIAAGLDLHIAAEGQMRADRIGPRKRQRALLAGIRQARQMRRCAELRQQEQGKIVLVDLLELHLDLGRYLADYRKINGAQRRLLREMVFDDDRWRIDEALDVAEMRERARAQRFWTERFESHLSSPSQFSWDERI